MTTKTKEGREAAILERIYELDTQTLSREQWEQSRTAARCFMLTDVEGMDEPVVSMDAVLRVAGEAIQLANTCNALLDECDRVAKVPVAVIMSTPADLMATSDDAYTMGERLNAIIERMRAESAAGIERDSVSPHEPRVIGELEEIVTVLLGVGR